MGKRRQQKGRQQVARANGRTVELAVQRALAELDFAPGELAEDQYEVTIITDHDLAAIPNAVNIRCTAQI